MPTNSLYNNRKDLKQKVDALAQNFEHFKGKLIYFNYDVGTGKTHQFAQIIPQLLNAGKRILILVYSYDLVKEWEERITQALSQPVDKTIYKICAAQIEHSYFPRFHLSNCPHSSKFNKLGLQKFEELHCRECSDSYWQCYSDHSSKIDNAKIVITSHAFYRHHYGKKMKQFQNFHAVIIDEISGIEASIEIDLESIKAAKGEVSLNNTFSKKPAKLVKIKNTLIDWLSQLESNLEEYKKQAIAESQTDKDYYRSTEINNNHFEKIIPQFDNDIHFAITNASEKDHRCLKEVYLNAIKIKNTTYDKVYLNTICQKYRTVSNNGRLNFKSEIISAQYIARDYFPLPPGNLGQTFIILSAINSIKFIENIFNHRVDEVYGQHLINNNYNLIETSYRHGESQGYSYYHEQLPNVKSQIDDYITEFIKKHFGKKMVIGGQKKWIGNDPLLIDVEIDGTLHKIQIINYEAFKILVDENKFVQTEYIPFIHFGLGGSNYLKDFSALLLIHKFYCTRQIKDLYQNKCGDYNLSNEEFCYNKDVAMVRQLEGRILRKCEDSPIKYIDRRMVYDIHVLAGYKLSDDGKVTKYKPSEINHFPRYEYPTRIFKNRSAYSKYKPYKDSDDEVWDSRIHGKIKKHHSRLNNDVETQWRVKKENYRNCKYYDLYESVIESFKEKEEIKHDFILRLDYWLFTTVKIIELFLPKINGKKYNEIIYNREIQLQEFDDFCGKHIRHHVKKKIGHRRIRQYKASKDKEIAKRIFIYLFSQKEFLREYLYNNCIECTITCPESCDS